MPRVPFELLWRWMVVLSAGSVVLGLLLCVLPGQAPGTPVGAWDEGMLAPFWAGPPPDEAWRYHRFASGLVGVSLVGWGIAYTLVAAIPFRRREPWAWWCFALGVTGWIASEAVLCASWGVTVELLFLGAAAVGFALPLALSWPFMRGGAADGEDAGEPG